MTAPQRSRDEASKGAARLRKAESIGRPLGDDDFLLRIERITERRLRPDKRGPKSKSGDAGAS